MNASHRTTSLQLFLDALCAVVELVFARRQLPRWSAGSSIGPSRRDEHSLNNSQQELTRRIAHGIPRVAARLPLKSDCLVQAIAAQNWLASRGIASDIVLGVPKASLRPFEAHAWRQVGGVTLIGGDASAYTPFE